MTNTTNEIIDNLKAGPASKSLGLNYDLETQTTHKSNNLLATKKTYFSKPQAQRIEEFMSFTTNVVGGGSNRYLEFSEPALANYKMMNQKRAENRQNFMKQKEKNSRLFDRRLN